MSEKFNFKQQTAVSLREKVTHDLREAILKGQLASGERIKEMDIAQQMGVSRGPVREAIRQLEREGLLYSQPYKETVVCDIDIDEVKEILLPIRYQLEWFVIQKYLHSMDDGFFQELQQIVDDMAQVGHKEADLLVEKDIMFHATIIKLATERTVLITWQSILNQIRLHFLKNIPFYSNENVNRLVEDHQQLLDTLKAGQLQDIQNEWARHIQGEGSLLCFIPTMA